MALGKREQALLGVLAGIGLLAGLYFGYDAYSRKRAQLTAQRDALERELNMVKEKVRSLEVLERQLAESLMIQSDLERTVPKEEEIPQLLRDLADMMAASGVELLSFQPSRPTQSMLPELNEIRVNISTRGVYANIIGMFRRLRSARRMIGVKSFSLSGGGGADPVLSCSVNLSVYCARK